MKAALGAGVLALLTAFAAHAESRGELLYSAHCIGCHTTKMHWRDGRAATDWPSVVAQVRKWQNAASLSWNDSDVLAVARYLNESFHHFEPSSSLPPAATTGTAPP